MFNKFQSKPDTPKYKVLRQAIEDRMAHVWSTMPEADARPTAKDIDRILQRYQRLSQTIGNSEKRRALLHATFNSLHPEVFADHEKRWARLKSPYDASEFTDPLFWSSVPAEPTSEPVEASEPSETNEPDARV